MAWVENEYGHVLMVRQANGNRVWTLPGGKIRSGEDLAAGLERELREEIGISLQNFRLAAIYDRLAKQNLAILFTVTLQRGELKAKDPAEIAEIAFKARIPSNASQSARFFWKVQRSGLE